MSDNQYNPNEERKFSGKEKVELCVACTIADELKRCESCPFNIGIQVRLVHNACLKMDVVDREILWSEMPQPLWDMYFDYISTIEWTYPESYNPYFRSVTG